MAKFKQAGAIVVRAGKSGPRILLVTARRNPNNWIFPKGHVESGETLKAAAVREAREEAGIEGRVVGAAGKMTFEFGDNTYRVHYFVVKTADPGRAAGRTPGPLAEVQAGAPPAHLRRDARLAARGVAAHPAVRRDADAGAGKPQEEVTSCR